MLLKLSLTVLLLYYIGVLWRYYRSDLAGLLGKDGTGEEETDGERQTADEPYTVMGKSTYQPFGERDEPEEETARDGDNGETDDARKGTDGDGQPETAAPETVEEPETADDDADYSDIEPEDDEEEEYVPSLEELEEEEEQRRNRREVYYGKDANARSQRSRRRHIYLFNPEDMDNADIISMVENSPTYLRDKSTLNSIKMKAEQEGQLATEAAQEAEGGAGGVITF